jgi:hypothetical protein
MDIDNNIVLMILLTLYLMIGFILYTVERSQGKTVNALVESRRSGARGRNTLNEFKAENKRKAKLSFVWPILILKYLKDAVTKERNRNS